MHDDVETRRPLNEQTATHGCSPLGVPRTCHPEGAQRVTPGHERSPTSQMDLTHDLLFNHSGWWR
jgi:hypothetical protein